LPRSDYFIPVGEMERARYAPRPDPLLYFCDKYRRLHFVWEVSHLPLCEKETFTIEQTLCFTPGK
jgi:hypothetical protein